MSIVVGVGWTASTAGEGATMAEALETTRAATFELLDALDAYGLTEPSANMEIGSCEDLGRMSQPSSSGRFLHADGRPSTLDDASAILALLVDAGWQPVDSERFDEGIEDLESGRFVVSIRRDEQVARVGLWEDEAYVAFDVWGECLPNSEDAHDLYVAIGQWDLLGPSPTPGSAEVSSTSDGDR